MKLSIIHLSDIHFSEKDEKYIPLAKELAHSSFSTYRDSSYCIVALTGDIAFSGKSSEYEIAETFLKELKEALKAEKDIPIQFIIAPGNHDCELSSNIIRDVLIDSVKSDPSKAKDIEIINECTRVQENFFQFRDKLINKPIYQDRLWLENEIEVGDMTIRLSTVNAAWMSSLTEKQGSLVFPIENYKDLLSCDFPRFSFIHHPLNWYCQNTYHSFKLELQQSTSILFSGHEHSLNSYNIENKRAGNTIYIESRALDFNSSDSGYSTVSFNTTNSQIIQKTFSLSGQTYSENTNENISTKLSTSHYTQKINPNYLKKISDIGAVITHPEKNRLIIDDIFIDPEFEKTSISEEVEIISLNDVDFTNNTTLILGEEQSGKTKILHNQFNNLLDNDIYPIYLDSRNLKRVTLKEFNKNIDRSISEIYNNKGEYDKLSKTKRALLIDNFDAIGSNMSGLGSILESIKDNYSTVIITSDDALETVLDSNPKLLNDFEIDTKLKIRDFNANLRNKLIKKWHLCSDEQDSSSFECTIHKTESIINTVLGKNLIPARPLYLLTLLQSTSCQDKEDLHNSGMSYYYQYLITKSLEDAGVSRSKFDEIFNYLSNLAWFIRSQDLDMISYNELSKFNNQFSENYTTTSLDKQLSILLNSKILSHNNNYYQFSYPYIKLFFTGKYFADHIDKPEIIGIIRDYCKNLSTRENSNTILFLTHHKSSDWVIDEISENLKSCFSDNKPIYFGEDSNYLNDLVGTVSEVIISDINIDKNQEDQRVISDSNSHEPSDRQLNDIDKEDTNNKIIETFKILRGSEVLGQILKNYYGSLTRIKKSEYIKEIADAPLRLLHYIFENTISNPDDIIENIEKHLLDKKLDLTKDEIKNISTKFISQFVCQISTGIVIKMTESINSEKLSEDIRIFSSNNNKIAYNLLEAATYLLSPNKLPIDKISNLAKIIENNQLAFQVLQNLALYHIHMFHTPDRSKQQLGSLVKINLSKQRTLNKPS